MCDEISRKAVRVRCLWNLLLLAPPAKESAAALTSRAPWSPPVDLLTTRLKRNLLSLNVDKTKTINFAVSGRTSSALLYRLKLHTYDNVKENTHKSFVAYKIKRFDICSRRTS